MTAAVAEARSPAHAAPLPVTSGRPALTSPHLGSAVS